MLSRTLASLVESSTWVTPGQLVYALQECALWLSSVMLKRNITSCFQLSATLPLKTFAAEGCYRGVDEPCQLSASAAAPAISSMPTALRHSRSSSLASASSLLSQRRYSSHAATRKSAQCNSVKGELTTSHTDKAATAMRAAMPQGTFAQARARRAQPEARSSGQPTLNHTNNTQSFEALPHACGSSAATPSSPRQVGTTEQASHTKRSPAAVSHRQSTTPNAQTEVTPYGESRRKKADQEWRQRSQIQNALKAAPSLADVYMLAQHKLPKMDAVHIATALARLVQLVQTEKRPYQVPTWPWQTASTLAQIANPPMPVATAPSDLAQQDSLLLPQSDEISAQSRGKSLSRPNSGGGHCLQNAIPEASPNRSTPHDLATRSRASLVYAGDHDSGILSVQSHERESNEYASLVNVLLSAFTSPHVLQIAEPRSMSSVLHALAKLQHRNWEAVHLICADFCSSNSAKLLACNVQDFALAAWSAAKLEYTEDAFWEAVNQAVPTVMSQSATAQNWANLLWALANIGHSEPQTMSFIADSVIHHGALVGANPQAYATFMWAYARSGAQPDVKLFDFLTKHVLSGCMAGAQPQNWANLMRAFAALGHYDPHLYDYAANAWLAGGLEGATARNWANLLWAFGSVRHHNQQLCMRGWDVLVQGQLAPGMIEDVLHLLWGLASVGFRGAEGNLDKAAEHVGCILQHPNARVDAAHLATLAWSIAALAVMNPRAQVSGMLDVLLPAINKYGPSYWDEKHLSQLLQCYWVFTNCGGANAAQPVQEAQGSHHVQQAGSFIRQDIIEVALQTLKHQSVTHSDIQQQIVAELISMKGQHGIVDVLIDYRVPQLSGVPRVDALVTLERGRQVALVVNGPECFAANSADERTGQTQLQDYFLRSVFGDTNVCHVRLRDWNECQIKQRQQLLLKALTTLK